MGERNRPKGEPRARTLPGLVPGGIRRRRRRLR